MTLEWSRDGADWPNRELSRFVATRGARFHVQRGGAGPRALLIHGAGGATHSWRDVIPALLPRVEILALDLPGQGFSRGTPQRYGLPLMAEDIGALLAAEDFAPRLVVAHSAGAAIALRMALDGRVAPEAVLGLNGALSGFRGPAALLFPALAKMLSLNPLTGAAFARAAAAPGVLRRLLDSTGSRLDARGVELYRRLFTDGGHVSATLAMMARWDLAPLLADLPRLAVPVTLAAGARDGTVPPEDAQRIAARLQAGHAVSYPDLGHLMHEEAPAVFADLIAGMACA